MTGFKSLRALALVLGLTAVVACDDDPLAPPPENQTAQLRAIHGSPDAPAVDVYVEGSDTPIFENLSYGDASTYATVPAGTYNVQLRGAGADPTSNPVFETGNISLANGSRLSALAAGLFSSADPADGFRVLPLFENFSTPGAGNAIARVVHASPDAPTVDIDVLNDGTSEIVSLERFEDTGAAGVELPAGSPLVIGIRSGGLLVTTFTTPALTAGDEYFVIADGLLAQMDLAADDAFKLLAVDQDGAIGFIEQDGPDVGSAMLRAVHASPDAPTVDVYAEGNPTPIITALEYGAASLYFPVPAGTYNVQLRAHPSTEADPIAYQTGPVDLAANQRVTAVAAGFLSSADPADAFRVLPLIEDFAEPSVGGSIVRVVHAAPDAPTVDIDVNDGEATISGLERFDDTGASGIDLLAGVPLQVGVSVPGGDPVTAFTTPALPEGEELFLIATGSLTESAREDTGFSLLAVGPGGAIGFIKQNPIVYALHGSPDAPAVDIYGGTTLLVGNLSFAQLSAGVQVQPAIYQLDFYEAGTGPGTPVVSFQTPELMAGSSYLAVAAGELSPEDDDQAFTLLAFEELFAEAPASRVRAIHASGDAPAVDIGAVDATNGELNPVLITNLSFGNASEPADGTQLPAGDLVLGIAPTGSTTPVATFDVTTTEGLQTFAVAIGALEPDVGDASFRLSLVVTSVSPWGGVEVLPN